MYSVHSLAPGGAYAYFRRYLTDRGNNTFGCVETRIRHGCVLMSELIKPLMEDVTADLWFLVMGAHGVL